MIESDKIEQVAEDFGHFSDFEWCHSWYPETSITYIQLQGSQFDIIYIELSLLTSDLT